MGENKKRKKIRGHHRVIEKHQEKITYELRQFHPDGRDIEKWEDDIRRHQREIAKLEQRLPGGTP
jgi:pyruvate-formate lyase-activating enzyme